MEPKRVFPLYVLILFGLVLVISLTLPGYFNFPYPQVLGPQFDPMLKRDKTDYISDNRPDMVLIGDSVLFLDVDEALLSQQLGLKAYSIALPGSGSAAWYLLLKNSILKSAHTPKYVVILFRDTLLTVPDYRTGGRYFGLLDDYARGREPLVTQLAFVNRMDPLEKLAEQYLPLYSARWQIREVVDRKVRYSASSLILQCSSECTDAALDSIFGTEKMDVEVLDQAAEVAGRFLYSPEAMDFQGQINRSFLPEIIRLAKKRGIRLILVRTKRLSDPTPAYESPALRRYISDLYAYLEDNHVDYLDLAHDERIKPEYFFDSLHLNAEGKEVFTRLLAGDLMPILRKP